MNWTYVIREVYCGKDWAIEDGMGEPPFPKHCNKKNVGSHCLDIDLEGTHCEYAYWCDVSKEFEYTNGDLINMYEYEEE